MLAEMYNGTGGEPGEVLRQLIVSLGGFNAGLALVLSVWRIAPWMRGSNYDTRRQAFSLFVGVLLLGYAGVCVLTTDHIYRHLLENDTPLWQLWMALLSFIVGGSGLIGLVATRPQRSRQETAE